MEKLDNLVWHCLSETHQDLALNNIFRKNKIPFLHTNADSAKNIELYEKLGFKIRREMSLWRFEP